jgi:hypothetical protein
MAGDSPEVIFAPLNLQKFPKDLRRRLNMKAKEKEIKLWELCAQYLEDGLKREGQLEKTK